MNGHARERQVRERLQEDGWVVVRAAGSLGVADLVALKAGMTPMVIEVKSTAAGPYKHFGPVDRAMLISAALQAGAEAWLCWWPPRGEPRWLGTFDWPAAGKAEGVEARMERV